MYVNLINVLDYRNKLQEKTNHLRINQERVFYILTSIIFMILLLVLFMVTKLI